jgi:hypothetical protein
MTQASTVLLPLVCLNAITHSPEVNERILAWRNALSLSAVLPMHALLGGHKTQMCRFIKVTGVLQAQERPI